MTEFTHHAGRVLEAAGIPPNSRSASELMSALAERARDWAERATAMGGEMDASSATRVAALALASDPELQKRLEDLEVDAIELLLKIQGVARLEPTQPADLLLRRRRWGDEGQPRAGAAMDPFTADSRVATQLIGMPVYGPDGTPVGAIERVMFGDGGREITGVTLCGGSLGH